MTHPVQPNPPEGSILRERLRQARWAFNLSVGFVSLSATATLAGVILLLSGNLSQGGYATLGGLTSMAVGRHCLQLCREANDRLDRQHP
jgi:hypothetical protein